MMRPHHPRRGPRHLAQQISHSGINVIPGKPLMPPRSKCCLIVRVKLAQIVHRGGVADSFHHGGSN